MGLPEYALRNAIRLIVAQRLLRRLCGCATDGDIHEARMLGLNVVHCRVPVGCDRCRQSGYLGRVLIAESLSLEKPRGRVAAGEKREGPGFRIDEGRNLRTSAVALVEAGVTSPVEVLRVLGWDEVAGDSPPGNAE
jgi:general secretion pathway protein E